MLGFPTASLRKLTSVFLSTITITILLSLSQYASSSQEVQPNKSVKLCRSNQKCFSKKVVQFLLYTRVFSKTCIFFREKSAFVDQKYSLLNYLKKKTFLVAEMQNSTDAKLSLAQMFVFFFDSHNADLFARAS